VVLLLAIALPPLKERRHDNRPLPSGLGPPPADSVHPFKATFDLIAAIAERLPVRRAILTAHATGDTVINGQMSGVPTARTRPWR